MCVAIACVIANVCVWVLCMIVCVVYRSAYCSACVCVEWDVVCDVHVCVCWVDGIVIVYVALWLCVCVM